MTERRIGMFEFMRLVKRAGAVKELSADEVAALQEKNLRELLSYAQTRSPYYARRFAGTDVARCALAELPILTRRDVMASFDDLVTDRALRYAEVRAFLDDRANLGRLHRGRYVAAESSGSSGVALVMVHDIDELNHVFATLAGRQALPRHPTSWQQTVAALKSLVGRKMRHASVLVTAGPTGSYVTQLNTPRFVSRLIDTRTFAVTTPLEELIQQLNEFQPQSIVSYPNTLEALAHAQLSGALKLRFDAPTAAITSGGEPLTEAAKALLRRAWNIEVEDVYAMTECLSVARTCPQFGGMHLMSDLCVLEIVDDDNRPVPAGQYGTKALLTSLYNRTMPLIRYEITDVVGVDPAPCTCGWPFPRLLPVKGRTYDRFYVARRNGGYEMLDLFRFGFLSVMNPITAYQLVQTARNAITIRYVPVEPSLDLEDEIRRGLDDARLDPFGITFTIERVATVETSKSSGKASRMVSRVGSPVDLHAGEAVS